MPAMVIFRGGFLNNRYGQFVTDSSTMALIAEM